MWTDAQVQIIQHLADQAGVSFEWAVSTRAWVPAGGLDSTLHYEADASSGSIASSGGDSKRRRRQQRQHRQHDTLRIFTLEDWDVPWSLPRKVHVEDVDKYKILGLVPPRTELVRSTTKAKGTMSKVWYCKLGTGVQSAKSSSLPLEMSSDSSEGKLCSGSWLLQTTAKPTPTATTTPKSELMLTTSKHGLTPRGWFKASPAK